MKNQILELSRDRISNTGINIHFNENGHSDISTVISEDECNKNNEIVLSLLTHNPEVSGKINVAKQEHSSRAQGYITRKRHQSNPEGFSGSKIKRNSSYLSFN